jgi:hypothetical protein
MMLGFIRRLPARRKTASLTRGRCRVTVRLGPVWIKLAVRTLAGG